MSQCNVNEFLSEQICELKKTIKAAQTARLSLIKGTIQSYTFDSGQTRQVVTKFNISELEGFINALYDDYVMLCNRVNGNGGGAIIGKPCF